jgi:hypothetical protein
MIAPDWFETVGRAHMRRFCLLVSFAARESQERGWKVSGDRLLSAYHTIFRGESYDSKAKSQAQVERHKRRKAALSIMEVEA